MEGGGHNVSVQGVSVTLQHLQPHHSILVRLLQRGGCLLALPPGGQQPSNTTLSAGIACISVSHYLSICSLAITAPVCHPSHTTVCGVELAACVHSVMWHELQLLSPWSRILFEMRN